MSIAHRGALAPSTTLLSLSLALAACSSTHQYDLATMDASAQLLDAQPVPVRGSGVVTDDRASLEAQPSSQAARMFPAGARYRVAIADKGDLAIAILDPHGRLLGRLHLRTSTADANGQGVEIEFEDQLGRRASISARTQADHIEGWAQSDGHGAHWRVHRSEIGELAGERWSPAIHGQARERELIDLAELEAVSGDLFALADALTPARSAATDPCELAELLVLGQLAVDLTIRTWRGEARRQLPALAHATCDDR
ncbi:hypothetical protein G6O69_21605 [Pseudenhygromyxa sp. WMMC2535]|uniref:hypothetical protein n=1 Tax=Pseudenhygromyxa sp. WMMC2535 TaxID=2712867 RepID=UPI001594FF47|nr:hypothetical protein [Pseudenhygromyxa sp. WMMC2535]NVB40451.1 hypothetical protein [Pseudenhygromyxa sp. WMMC2535]